MTTSGLPDEHFRLVESPRQCSYIESETASLEYRLFPSLTPAQVQTLLERGWRRFGVHVFRPACETCQKCVPIRVNVNRFKPTKSQRRNRKRNSHLTVSLASPAVTEEHVDLYNRWHVDMTARRGWNKQATTPRDYWESFLMGKFESLKELRYFDGDRLIGVGLIDVLPDAISSAYFFHDPEWRDLGPGTFSLLCEIDLAQRLGLSWLYLGYWIDECPSMSYKNRFQPAEIHVGTPADDQSPQWINDQSDR